MNCLLINPRFPVSYLSYTSALKFLPAKAANLPLSLLTVAALLPENWQTRLVDLNVSDLSEDDWNWADTVLLSGMHIQKKGILTLIQEAKKRKKTTSCGGPYATLLSQELLEAGCDLVVCGEAETIIKELCDCLEEGQTGKIIRAEKRCNLKESPIPRFELVNLKDYFHLAIQTTRGCPYSCEFCDIASLYGRSIRWKDPGQVVDELEQLYQLGRRGMLLIADDNFIANRNNAKAICEKIIEWNRKRKEPFGFVAQVTTDLGQDLEMIDMMTAANFSEVLIGIESIDEQSLIASNKHHNVRNPLVESITAIKKNGLSVIGSFILGFDNEEKGVDKRIYNFVEQTSIPIVWPNLLTAMPKTKLWNRLKNEGRLASDGIESHTGDTVVWLPNFTPTRPVEEIAQEYIDIWKALYEPSKFFERTYKYCLEVRPTRQAAAGKKKSSHSEDLPQTAPGSLADQLFSLRIFLNHIWIYGVKSPIRFQFWKQLIGMYKRNPSRLAKYISHCVYGHEMILFQSKVAEQLSGHYSSLTQSD